MPNRHAKIGRMVTTGLDVLMKRKKILAGRKIGLVANPSSVDSKVQFILDLFLQEKSWEVTALFGPEHGLRAELQAEEWSSEFKDPVTGLPVYSLYGERLKPEPQMLDNVDTIVFDMQDVGSRYYTFIYTLSYIMEACMNREIEVVVLDRPNPINGVDVEGPVLEKGYESFVGRYPIPTRHGMTIGEIALLFKNEFGVDCKLQIISMEDWNRDSYYEEKNLPWVLPSPNMPTVDTAIVYPGQCLLEGTNMSEGRGTTRPFEIFGAPWIDPKTLITGLSAYQLHGVIFRPLYFQPTFSKHAGKLCGGAQIHVINRHQFKPVKMTLALLHWLLQTHPGTFRWKDPPYEYVTDRLPIDILFGNSWIREELEKGTHPDDIEKRWQSDLKTFLPLRSKYLLY
jgi:uncharacterized protein YbbC (DUF1343 family)